MLRILDSSCSGLIKVRFIDTATFPAREAVGPKLQLLVDCTPIANDRERPAEPPKKFGPGSVPKSYPIRLIRKVVRNHHIDGTAPDLQLLRSARWPARKY
jgi:hypothetical protein